MRLLGLFVNWPVPPTRDAFGQASSLTRYMSGLRECGYIGTTIEGPVRWRLEMETQELETALWRDLDSPPSSPSLRPERTHILQSRANQRSLYARLVVAGEPDDEPGHAFSRHNPELTRDEWATFEGEVIKVTFTDKEQRRWDAKVDREAKQRELWRVQSLVSDSSEESESF
jgi:hypothetical protein